MSLGVAESTHARADGAGEWRVRTGVYRVVHSIQDDVLLVLVLAVGHRRDIHA